MDNPTPHMRAKFTLQTVLLTTYGEQLTFGAQYSNSKEDNSFSDATPSASLSMSVTNKELFGKFKPGQQFYVDFTPAE